MDIVYIVFIVGSFVYGFILADLTYAPVRDWRFWVMAVFPSVFHICGRLRGF